LARWDESKKKQHKIEILKNRLTEADGEVSKLSKTNNSLRYSLNKVFVDYRMCTIISRSEASLEGGWGGLRYIFLRLEADFFIS
jgi:hypothetical protein